MSLWWTRKEQLDKHQLNLIEDLPLRENHLILGPPGSGKTNVLLRRAQFVRSQGMPNVLVLSFTRSLVEFLRTGCFDDQGREIFPRTCVTTMESWIRALYRQHEMALPQETNNLTSWKQTLAGEATGFAEIGRLPPYDTLFVDEAQDLLPEEVDLLVQWSPVLFFVGDDRQRIYEGVGGLRAVRKCVVASNENVLPFHYRLAPEICQMADRILTLEGGKTLSGTQHYKGPRPGRIEIVGPLSKEDQMRRTCEKLRDQIRAYADLIRQGDLLGIIVARRNDRNFVHEFLERDEALQGKSQIIRARSGDDDDDHDPAIDTGRPICILTVNGCKGLEFRAVHWLFCDDLSVYHSAEHYYTVVTRAKTSLDISYTHRLPDTLARAYAPSGLQPW